jgi:hypothetical protein
MHARGDEAAPVIPPGREAAVLDLLGGSEALAGCRLAGARIDGRYVAADYACTGGAAHVELRHPSEQVEAAARTRAFALVVRGAAPPDLVAALAERVRAREGAWQWSLATPPSAGAAPPSRSSDSRRLAVWTVAAALLAAALLWLLGRADRRRESD